MDARTGELLAMVSLPTFDPESPATALADARFNRASLGVYKMGSVFKIFSTALALDSGVVGLSDGYDVREPIRSEEHTSELQSLMRISYAVFRLNKKTKK